MTNQRQVEQLARHLVSPNNTEAWGHPSEASLSFGVLLPWLPLVGAHLYKTTELVTCTQRKVHKDTHRWSLRCRTYCSVTAKFIGKEVSPLPVRRRTRRCGRIPRSQIASGFRLLKERSRNYGANTKEGRT